MKKKTIRDMIIQVQDEISHPTLNQLKPIALRIILKAVGTKDWDDIIKAFVDNNNPDQLARLRLKDSLSQTDPYMQQAMAYLMANITCGGSTPLGLLKGIPIRKGVLKLDEAIDYGLAPAGNKPPAKKKAAVAAKKPSAKKSAKKVAGKKSK